MASKIYRLTVEAAAGGTRLDQYVASQISDLSRGVVRKIIDLGGVHVAGRRTSRCSLTVRPGQSVDVYLDDRPLDIFTLGPDQVLFQDSFLLVVNKPAGIDCQPTHARFKGTLYDAVRRHLESAGGCRKTPEIGMVQRLDRETSGVTVFSVHQRSHSVMTRMFAERRVAKGYQTLVAGLPEVTEGEFRSLLARQHRTNLMKSVQKGGKEAITRYRVITELDGCALVEVDLVTGRSHQIRVHFSEAGHPLLGDRRYGGPGLVQGHEVRRTMLHSYSLSFDHPVNRQPLCFVAPLAADMASLYGRLSG